MLTDTIGFVALEVPRCQAGFTADGSSLVDLDAAVELLDDDLFPRTNEIRPLAGERRGVRLQMPRPLVLVTAATRSHCTHTNHTAASIANAARS